MFIRNVVGVRYIDGEWAIMTYSEDESEPNPELRVLHRSRNVILNDLVIWNDTTVLVESRTYNKED